MLECGLARHLDKLPAFRPVRDTCTATLVGSRAGALSHFLHYLFTEDLGGRLPREPFARPIVERGTDIFHVLIRNLPEVLLPRKPPSGAPCQLQTVCKVYYVIYWLDWFHVHAADGLPKSH